ncbi:AAA family ATPase [Paenibacillus sp. JDR-2]|uniref:AAA family ATPase n=1 Tax=Paenibacillus sp. (strain JDR-2) TaxID=324057 RepID=UPI0002DE514A|nr:AAA family ATPase [Paenibacillus sp. JDR-2]
MNQIFLPELKRIEIKNFSLYKKDIHFEFIHGVNLIVGGNGVGKTTFINLIKYGLIGLYKKELDVRTYKSEKRLVREQYSQFYFKNRMYDEELYKNEDAEVILTFNINKTQFVVTRGLNEIILKKVIVIENNSSFELDGIPIRQDKYEKLDEDDRKNFLQGRYEELVSSKSNINDFNDLIFFVNQILFFDEDRKTIIWEPLIQERLSSKYFNDPRLDEEFQEAKRQAKYHDSISRHKSEDIRAISKIVKRLEGETNDTQINGLNEINKLKKKLDKANELLNDIQTERKGYEIKISICVNQRVNHNRKAKELEKQIKEEESSLYRKIWGTRNPNYNIYYDNLKMLHLCPMCNQNVTEEHLTEENECFLCHQSITTEVEIPTNVKEMKLELEKLLLLSQSCEKEIYNLENELRKMDSEYNKLKREVFELQSKVRELDHKMYSNNERSDESFTYTAMMAELDELEREKQENVQLSDKYNHLADEIIQRIESNLSDITKELSGIFSDFAGDFLGVDCRLTFDNLIKKEVKMYIPVIGDKVRLDPLELSESQRFFTDQAFRMSLLNYFYTTPSFFVCETPDSSLDVSYEANAAQIFLKYLQQPNTLIVTSNLNNSEFLDLIIQRSTQISFLNLLEYGKPSIIQKNSDILLGISKRIEEKINAKKTY